MSGNGDEPEEPTPAVVDDATTPSSVPLDAATEALRKAAAARGVDYEPPKPRAEVTPAAPEDPVASVEAALEKAAEAREYARTDQRAAARESRARVELERLKRGGGTSPGVASTSDDEPSDDEETRPRTRRL